MKINKTGKRKLLPSGVGVLLSKEEVEVELNSTEKEQINTFLNAVDTVFQKYKDKINEKENKGIRSKFDVYKDSESRRITAIEEKIKKFKKEDRAIILNMLHSKDILDHDDLVEIESKILELLKYDTEHIKELKARVER